MPDTRTERLTQIANDLEDEGLYTAANSVRSITEERDRLAAIKLNPADAQRFLAFLEKCGPSGDAADAPISICHPTGSEEFAGQLEQLGVPAPWHVSDEAVPTEAVFVRAANGEVACVAGHDGLASDKNLLALAAYIMMAVNTLAGFRVEIT